MATPAAPAEQLPAAAGSRPAARGPGRRVSLCMTVKDEAALITWCREHMANYKVPREVHFVDELPLTASGKVQRFRLRQPGA